jgi:hypothetical protein
VLESSTLAGFSAVFRETDRCTLGVFLPCACDMMAHAILQASSPTCMLHSTCRGRLYGCGAIAMPPCFAPAVQRKRTTRGNGRHPKVLATCRITESADTAAQQRPAPSLLTSSRYSRGKMPCRLPPSAGASQCAALPLGLACTRQSSCVQAIRQLAHSGPGGDPRAAVRGDAHVHNGAAACSVMGCLQQCRSLLQPTLMCESACGLCQLSILPHALVMSLLVF